MLPNRASICDFVCSRCWLRSACRAACDRRFLVGEGLNIVSANMLRSDGLENARVIDFVKHSLKIGLPDLASEALAEGKFAAQSAQNLVIYMVLVHHKPLGQPKTLYFTAFWASSRGPAHAGRCSEWRGSSLQRTTNRQTQSIDSSIYR